METAQNYRDVAKNLVINIFNLLSVQFDSDGDVLSKANSVSKAKIVAHSHIQFLLIQDISSNLFEYWTLVNNEIDNIICIEVQ